MQNTNDLKREHQAKPSAGYDQSRHAGKDPANQSRPSQGAIEHPEKADGKNRQEQLSKPGPSGGQVRPQKKDHNTASADSRFADKVG